MRGEYWYYAFWLVVVGSWVFGVAYGRWGDGSGIFAELGRAVSIPSPEQLSWWQPLPYFALTIIAIFMLSQIFFGAGAALFLFSRGVQDAMLISKLEIIMGRWTPASVSPNELWTIFFILLVLTVNLPLCLWSAHLGTQRAMQVLYRIRGKPLKRMSEVGPIPNVFMAVAASLAAGLIATFVLSYA
ncbi:MAG: hypothetical protein DRN83_03005 [Hadesarchaea archaeon]|nr:MAG: hypothetical protein DRN83_03005 [Hadesarchaea archaeon]